MKKLFALGVFALAAFEALRIWPIMPMPGSQTGDLAWAYLLHRGRWVVRGLAALAILWGLRAAWRGSRVRDTLGGRPVVATYCTVCRTGRVFEPVVDGREQELRLVGMDLFNAMFEDAETGSWWRQTNGVAVAGPRAGQSLPEVPSMQTTLRRWLVLHPESRVLQPDPAFQEAYDGMSGYEAGKGGSLTGRALDAWAEKAWVVGVTVEGESCAYDWGAIEKQRVILHELGSVRIAVVLAGDGLSFAAFRRTGAVALEGDVVVMDGRRFSLEGVAEDGGPSLPRVSASQEFWHSWRSFHPETTRF